VRKVVEIHRVLFIEELLADHRKHRRNQQEDDHTKNDGPNRSYDRVNDDAHILVPEAHTQMLLSTSSKMTTMTQMTGRIDPMIELTMMRISLFLRRILARHSLPQLRHIHTSTLYLTCTYTYVTLYLTWGSHFWTRHLGSLLLSTCGACYSLSVWGEWKASGG
jgi:hypothetical protein